MVMALEYTTVFILKREPQTKIYHQEITQSSTNSLLGYLQSKLDIISKTLSFQISLRVNLFFGGACLFQFCYICNK